LHFKSTAVNTRFALLQILYKPDVFLSQEIVSLTENNQFRTSQQRKAWERQAVKNSYFLLFG